jgi:hypothetical protein
MIDARLIHYLESIGSSPESLDGWSIKTALRDGKECGFVITRGPEIHMLAFDDGAMSRKNVIEAISPILAEFGYCTTRVPISETNHKLRMVLGFIETWRDHQFSYWAMTEPPFQRKTT